MPRHKMVNILVAAMLLLLGKSAFAAAPGEYEIHYEVTRGGDAHGKAVRRLTKTSNNMYELTAEFSASLLFYEISRKEVSRFSASGERYTPLTYYITDKRTFKDKKTAKIVFDYKAGLIKSSPENTTIPFTFEDNYADPLLAYDILIERVRGGLRGNVDLQVIDDGEPDIYHFEFNGEEKLNTRLGEINTLHFTRIRENSSRRTSMWLSPEHDFLPVKLEQKKEGEEQATLVVKTLTVEAKKDTPR